jgi:small subunit ribosomal protein S5
VYTRRIAKVVKGGRRLRFNALVVVGDGQGQVGAGMGKAIVIPDAVRKGNAIARREMVTIPIKGSTIPHEITVKKGASIVVIKPAREGTGIIAAGAMRAMLELGGVQDVVGKSLGSRNPINIVQATLKALRLLRDPDVEMQRRLGNSTQANSRQTPDATSQQSLTEDENTLSQQPVQTTTNERTESLGSPPDESIQEV